MVTNQRIKTHQGWQKCWPFLFLNPRLASPLEVAIKEFLQVQKEGQRDISR